MKEKIKNWYKEQSKYSKIIFSITLILYLGVALHITPSHIGLAYFLGRVFGSFAGLMTSPLLISLVLALIPRLIFKNRYFDYFSVIFLIISLYYLYNLLTHPIFPNL